METLYPENNQKLTDFGNPLTQSELNQIGKQMMADEDLQKAIGLHGSDFTRLIDFTDSKSKELAQLIKSAVRKTLQQSRELTLTERNPLELLDWNFF